MEPLRSQIADKTEYSLAGLRIHSELPLPVVLRPQSKAPLGEEIDIEYGSVPEHLTSARIFPETEVCGDELLLTIPNVARFLVKGGRQISIEAAPLATESDISAWLLGTVFGALCHQRGIMPLHGSAVDVADGCVVFVGASGAGKSTLAAALSARGHQVISDDVCFLRRSGKGGISVWPGIGRIRLWPDALEALGFDKASIERELRGYNKFLVPIAAPADPFVPRPLRGIYQLEASENFEPHSIHRLSGAATIELVLPNVYRLTLAEHIGAKPAIFALCTAIANEVPVYRFRRQVGFDFLKSAIDRLESHLLDGR